MSSQDVFSALNIGSGMNTTELIQNLLTAERSPKEKRLMTKLKKMKSLFQQSQNLKNQYQNLRKRLMLWKEQMFLRVQAQVLQLK